MIDHNDLLIGTNQLQNDIDNVDTDEYKYRNYCGRAYYTAYHTLINHLNAHHDYNEISNQLPYINMGTHVRLLEFMQSKVHDERLYRSLVYRTNAMRGLRVKADYKLQDTFDQIDYQQAKQQLVGIISLIQQLEK